MVFKSKKEKMPDKIKKNLSEKIKISSDVEWTFISLRITDKILEDINSMLKTRVGIPRNGWILEAIQEKIKKSEK
jgi:hypothetical protein